MKTTEYAKLITHCTLLYNDVTSVVTALIRGQLMSAITLICDDIEDFDKTITSMDVYTNKETERFMKQLQTADDTIKALCLELKAFRRSEKKQNKKDRIPPPAYTDACPPEI